MKSRLCSLVLLASLATSLNSIPAEEVAAHPLQLLVHANGNYERWQFEVHIGKKPLFAYWDDVFRSLFEFADANGDGQIEKSESQLLPSAHGIRQTLWARFLPTSAQIPWTDLDADGNAAVTHQELARYYRRQGLGNVIVAVGVAPASRQLSNALAAELGLDEDMPISEERWKAAVRAISRLDKNEDSLIGPGELVSTLRYPGSSATQLLQPAPAHSMRPAKLPLTVLPSVETDADWPKLLPDLLTPADLNGDGESTQTESKEWLSRLPKRSWSLQLDSGEAIHPASSATAERSVAVSGLSAMIDILPSSKPATVLGQLDRYRAQFREVDSTDDGVLDAEKLKAHPQLRELPKLFRLADRNRNGQFTSAEFDRWQRLQQAYVRGGVLLSILDFDHGLFELLDENFDGSLSQPELDAGWKRLAEAGVLDDRQKYSASRLPRQLRLTLSLGRPVTQLRSSTQNAPPWFLAMDRNKDRRLSRAEFLGSDEEFDKLDTDRDKLISSPEASRK